MEPTNPLLPALRPDMPALLRRTGSLLGAVQGIQQEANAEYWYVLLQDGTLDADRKQAIVVQCSELLRRDIEASIKLLETQAEQTYANGESKYTKMDADEDGWGGWYFDDESFFGDQKEVFDKLFSNYQKLASLQTSSAFQTRIMADGAEHIRRFVPTKIYTFWSETNILFQKEESVIPVEPTIYLHRAWRRRLSEHRYTEALDDLTTYLSIVKTDAYAFKQRGRLRYQLGDIAGMVEDAASAQQLGAVLEDNWPGDPPLGPNEPPF